jgi:hypothetical protein
VAVNHWAVRERPELFTPCDAGDTTTATTLKRFLTFEAERERKAIRNQRGMRQPRPATTRRPLRLPT